MAFPPQGILGIVIGAAFSISNRQDPGTQPNASPPPPSTMEPQKLPLILTWKKTTAVLLDPGFEKSGGGTQAVCEGLAHHSKHTVPLCPRPSFLNWGSTEARKPIGPSRSSLSILLP